jgi:hypothetical protein
MHDLREKRMESSEAERLILHAAEWDNWHHFVISDESWLFLNILSRRMWTISRDNMVTKLRLDIQNKTFMFTIIWNLSVFYVIKRFLNDTKMNSDYFMTNILIPLEQTIVPRGRVPHQKRFVIHLDNCWVHTNRASTDWLEEHGMRCMPHPHILFTWFGFQWLLLVSYSKRKLE